MEIGGVYQEQRRKADARCKKNSPNAAVYQRVREKMRADPCDVRKNRCGDDGTRRSDNGGGFVQLVARKQTQERKFGGSVRKMSEIKNPTLRDLRIQAGKTVEEIAEVLNVANSTYYNYETGQRRLPIEFVLELSKYYDCSAEEVILAHLNSRPKDQVNNRTIY